MDSLEKIAHDCRTNANSLRRECALYGFSGESQQRAAYEKRASEWEDKANRLESLIQRITNATARAVESTLSALLEANRQGEAAKQGAAAMRAALQKITDYVDRNTCRHEETHRGGAIWEICDHCGEKWADDEGGRPEFVEPKELVDAREALSSDSGREYAEQHHFDGNDFLGEIRAEIIERGYTALKWPSHLDDEGPAWSAAEAICGILERLRNAQKELEQYKRDAERYRWLRERDVDTIHKGGVFAGVIPENLVINEEDLDMYIDSAMLNAVSEKKQG